MLSLHNDISTYKWLKSLYPSCITELKELDELLKVEAKASEDFNSSLELVINNKFIDTMDEKMVEEFEKFFDITISSDKSLDERRNIIKAYYGGHGKLTMGQLCNIVSTIANGTCKGEFKAIDSTKNNYIVLTTSDCDIKNNITDIIQAINTRIPAHLPFVFQYKPSTAKNKVFFSSSSITSFSSVALASTSMQTVESIDGGTLSSTSFANTVDGGKLNNTEDRIIINGNYL